MNGRIWCALASLVGLVLVAVGGDGGTASATGGCPSPWIYAESQAWWFPAPGTVGGKDYGHVHVGACIPERDTLAASTTLPVTVVLHNNPGVLQDVGVVFKTASSETTVASVAPVQRTCPGMATCAIPLSAPIDISQFPHSGLQEIRLRVFVTEPDGKILHTSLNFQTYVENGKSRSDVTREPYLRSKGWYTGFGYCEADVLGVPVPDGPLSGTVHFVIQQVDHGPGDVDPSYHRVALDSDAHAGIPGTVMAEGFGPMSTTLLTVDTTGLSNGTHRLVQRVECARGNQVLAGVSVLRFDVRN
jgi:hypothetical protein